MCAYLSSSFHEFAIRKMECLLSILLLGLAAQVNSHDGLSHPEAPVSYDEQFLDGIKAYSEEKWSDCVLHIRQAMYSYDRAVRARVKCYDKCNKQDSLPSPSALSSDDEPFMLLFGILHRSACIENCEESYLGARPTGGVPYSVHERVDSKETYNYLQMALFKNGQVKEAARACATFAYFHPRDANSKVNIQFYGNQLGVLKDDLWPQELLKYRELYREGQALYGEYDWLVMVDKFEKALKEFYIALDECQALCQGPMKFGKTLDFAQVVTRHFSDHLECRSNCVAKLGDFRGDTEENFFGSFFHFLQFGYYSLNRSLDAIESSATQERLEPDSDDAKGNAVFYRQQPGVTRNDFKPRKDVLPLIEELEAEMALMHIIDELSGFQEAQNADKVDPEAMGGDEWLLQHDFEQFPVGSSEETTGPVVARIGQELFGEERVVVDRLMTEEECQGLIELAANHAKEGDGYNRKSPHTQNEHFVGLHILDAAKGAAKGEINSTQTELYINASYLVKDMVAKHFNLEQPLYFSYTHLVCRTAKEGLQDVKGDLSHPVHSDNCILDEISGECNKVPPAYTWRDYSGLMYLNRDFGGGKFFFAHSTQDLSPEVFVSPMCGRMVGFSAGKENMHGVTSVTQGRRCAVALWFTLDPDHREPTFDEAESILKGLHH